MSKKFKNLIVSTIPISKIKKVEIVSLGNLTMGQWYKKQTDKPEYMSSASLWDSKGSIGTIYQDGKIVRNMGNGFGFGVAKNGSIGFGNPWDYDWKDYITGYPGLVKNGLPLPLTLTDKYVMNAVTKRSAVCADGNNLYLVAGNSLDVKNLQKQLLEFGAYHAINLDGGGTSRLMENGKAINTPSDDRACKLAICVWMKK